MSERVLRASLWLACPFNLLAAAIVLLPGSWLGQLYGLPADVPPLYAALTAMFIALFGGAYLWLAVSRTIDRALLALGAIGKLAAFGLSAVLALSGQAPVPVALAALGDLAFALVWLTWLRSGRQPE